MTRERHPTLLAAASRDQPARRRGPRRVIGRAAVVLAGGLAVAVASPAFAVDEPAQSEQAARGALAPDFASDVEARKRYGVAALEIVGFDVLLNQANRRWSGSSDYDSNLSTIRRNLRSSWGVDNDPFNINQLGHPYQGSIYHGIARSNGLGYWESAAYTFAGSIFWEIAGEKTRPSANDQVASGVGGSFLGEALFRMASLVLENGRGPKLLREAGAAVISPPTGFNRLAFGYANEPIFSSHDADYYSRAQVGVSRSSENDAGLSATPVKRNEALANFEIDYGLPGKSGYEYRRPFDYFAFQATASSASGFENVLTRGSLLVRPYEAGPRTRGIVGLYGSYDYIAPQTFRVSSTALSLGTTAQYNASDLLTFQGSALLGLGYAAVGTVRSTDEKDYQYGVAPQGLLAMRIIYGNKLSLDVTGREYFVSRVAAAKRGGHENIARLDASLTYRVSGPHAVSIKYLGNRRDISYPDLGDRKQTRATIGIYYTYLGHDRFADEPESLEVTDAQVDAHRNLLRQLDRLFGARHFAHYDLMLALSDDHPWAGLEHHQSSENATKAGYFKEWDKFSVVRDLLPHEFAHSWNGKFRRPRDLWAGDFNVPTQNSLLWVYEGQTQYWGQVLAARSGLIDVAEMREWFAWTAAAYETLPGRSWRSMQDTVHDEIISGRQTPLDWPTWQRFEDYYEEGALMWLDVDTRIRQQSDGKRSLDDFARGFFGVDDGRVAPLLYDFGDVVAGLARVMPYDWAGFLRAKLDRLGESPLAGLERSGWRLAWTEKQSDLSKHRDGYRESASFRYSLGFTVDKKDTVVGVVWDSPAFRAGMAKGLTVLAVNFKAFKPDVLRKALDAAKGTSEPIELLVKDGTDFRIVRIDYHRGQRYPTLERIEGVPDLLTQILTAR